MTLIISRNRQATDFSLTEAETVARTRGLDPGDWTPDLCSPWKSVWPLFGAAPSLGLTWFRCGVAFAGPTLWASSGSRGRSGSGRKAPGASPVNPSSCPQPPPPFLPHWLPRAPAVWEFLTLVPSGRSGSRRVTAGSTFWPVAGMKEHLETGLKPHLLTRHICPDSEAPPHLTSFVLASRAPATRKLRSFVSAFLQTDCAGKQKSP